MTDCEPMDVDIEGSSKDDKKTVQPTTETKKSSEKRTGYELPWQVNCTYF